MQGIAGLVLDYGQGQGQHTVMVMNVLRASFNYRVTQLALGLAP